MGEAEDADGSGAVRHRLVVRLEGLAPVNGVAREDPGRVLHHGLGVAGVAADGVQLEQLAALVLVGPVTHVGPVVQVQPHRRVQRGGQQEVLEPAEGVLADRGVVVEAPDPGPVVVGRDVQRVAPEVDHLLQDGAFGVDPAQHRPVGQLVGVDPAALDLADLLLPAGRGLVEPQRGEPVVDDRDLGVLRDAGGLELRGQPRLGGADRAQLSQRSLREAGAEAVQEQPLPGAGRSGRGHRRRLHQGDRSPGGHRRRRGGGRRRRGGRRAGGGGRRGAGCRCHRGRGRRRRGGRRSRGRRGSRLGSGLDDGTDDLAPALAASPAGGDEGHDRFLVGPSTAGAVGEPSV